MGVFYRHNLVVKLQKSVFYRCRLFTFDFEAGSTSTRICKLGPRPKLASSKKLLKPNAPSFLLDPNSWNELKRRTVVVVVRCRRSEAEYQAGDIWSARKQFPIGGRLCPRGFSVTTSMERKKRLDWNVKKSAPKNLPETIVTKIPTPSDLSPARVYARFLCYVTQIYWLKTQLNWRRDSIDLPFKNWFYETIEHLHLIRWIVNS